MQPSGIDCLYRKQSGVYGCKYQLLQPLGMSACIESSQGCMGANISYCSRSDMSARIRISRDVLAENHLPVRPISPAGC